LAFEGQRVSTDSEIDVPHVDHIGGDGPDVSLPQRVAELEAQVTQLEEALASRRQVGLITGVLAERVHVSPDEAWSIMVRLSSHTNLKVREVARILHAGYFGELARADLALAARLDEHLPQCGRINPTGAQTTTQPEQGRPTDQVSVRASDQLRRG